MSGSWFYLQPDRLGVSMFQKLKIITKRTSSVTMMFGEEPLALLGLLNTSIKFLLKVTVPQMKLLFSLFSKHWPSWLMLPISWNVRVSVCSLLRYCLNVLLPSLPEVGCPKFLEIQNPWGKVVERSGLRCEHFFSKTLRQFFFFFTEFFLHLFTFEVPFERLLSGLRFENFCSKMV